MTWERGMLKAWGMHSVGGEEGEEEREGNRVTVKKLILVGK